MTASLVCNVLCTHSRAVCWCLCSWSFTTDTTLLAHMADANPEGTANPEGSECATAATAVPIQRGGKTVTFSASTVDLTAAAGSPVVMAQPRSTTITVETDI